MVQEQRVVIDNLYKETNGAYTARTDESRVVSFLCWPHKML